MMRRMLLPIAGASVFLVAVLPVVGALYQARSASYEIEQAKLEVYAKRALARAEAVVAEAGDALRQFAASSAPVCSDADITALRLAVFKHRFLRAAYGTVDGRVACSSIYGRRDGGTLRAPDWESEGFSAWFNAPDDGLSGERWVNFAYQGRIVSMAPADFIDILPDRSDRALGLVEIQQEHVIAAWANTDPSIILRLARQSGHQADGDMFYVIERSANLPVAVVVGEPAADVAAQWQSEALTWLPVSALLGTALAGLVAYLVRRRLSLRGELVAALRLRALTVAYQPIVDLSSGRCVGAEALVRWRQADGTFVSPSLFIPLAEDAGLVPEITDQVLAATLRDLGDFLRVRQDIYVSINVGAEDLTRLRFLDRLGDAIASSGIRPNQIRIEATERGFLQASAAQEVIAAFRRAGHPVCIDDFGTGYSSLAYLEKFSVDCLKIDKSFIDTIGTEAVTSSVVPHIIDMARTLGLYIVAEGVETNGQASYLQARGVRYCQGWLFSKAVPAAEFLRFVDRHHMTQASGRESAPARLVSGVH